MECEQTRPLLHGYLDGELEISRVLDLEAHLEGCHGCRSEHESLRGLLSAMGESAHYAAPDSLRKRIRSEMQVSAIHTLTSISAPWRQLGFGMILFLTGAFVAVVATTRTLAPDERDSTINSVVSSHVRSMMVTHLTDISSSDTHTVKPWFNEVLDYSLPVHDFPNLGFNLIGGRLDFVAERPVAALAYGRREHKINLFVWPTTEMKAPDPISRVRRGYNLIGWSSDDLNYWLISDLDAGELKAFYGMLRDRFSGRVAP